MMLCSWHEGAAVFFLLAVFLWPLLLAWCFSRRSGFSLVQVLVLFPAMVFAYCLWRARRRNVSHRPIEGGGIIVCNHRSSIDPFFIQVAIDRPVYWMIAREYCERPLLSLLLKPVPIIPAGRKGVDSAAIRQAIEKAQQGFLVGIFPEGRINTTTEFMLSVRPGAMMIALKAGVPIIPFFLEGSPFRGSTLSPFMMTADVRMEIGESYDPAQILEEAGECDSREQLSILVLDAVRRIARLGGAEGFVPQLAGRKWLDEG